MHIKSIKWFIDTIRYGILVCVIIFNVAMLRNTTYSVQVPVLRADGSQYTAVVSGLTEPRYDSLLNSMPDPGNARYQVIDSRQTYYFNRLPAKTINIVYSIYIYYLVVIAIRIIMYVRGRVKG